MSFGERKRRAASFRAETLALFLFAASPARAGEELTRAPLPEGPSRVSASFAAPPECPSEARFSEILRDKGVDSLSIDGTQFASVRFELRVTNGGYEAAVLGRTFRGQPIERRVSGATCLETAEALALIWTLVLRENREEVSSAPPNLEPETPVAAPPKIEEPTTGEVSSEKSSSRSFGFEARALVAGALGRSPELTPTAIATIGFGFGSRSLFSPLVRLGGSLGFETVTPVEGGSALFSSYLGRLELCVLRARLGSFATFRLCETNDGGVILARGRGFDVTGEVVAKVFGMGALGAFELGISNGFGLELGFEVKAELLTGEFELNRKLVFSTPHGSGNAFIGLRFDTFDESR